MAQRRFTGRIILMLGSLLIWAAHFSVVYLFNAIACAWQFAHTDVFGFAVVPVIAIAATAVAVLAMLGLTYGALYRQGAARGEAEPPDRFLRYTALGLALLGLTAVIWQGIPALIVPLCA